jgi:hypothetical protein
MPLQYASAVGNRGHTEVAIRAHVAPAVVALFGLIVSLAACRAHPNESNERRHELNLPPVASSVSVHFDGASRSVELAGLVRDSGADSVALEAVFKAAWPSEDVSRLHFDLVGSDGFRPTSRPKCPRPLTGEEVAHVRLNVVTHDARVEDGLNLPGCYHVRSVVMIEATR